MAEKMLIDASHPEETRVVVVRGNRIEEFDFESQHKKQLRGNIYLAKVTRVEPSLQAAFVDYGGNRHGFLAFSEIHPDYYQIPLADRQALLQAEADDARNDPDFESTDHDETEASDKKKADKQAKSAKEDDPTKRPRRSRRSRKKVGESETEATVATDAQAETGANEAAEPAEETVSTAAPDASEVAATPEEVAANEAGTDNHAENASETEESPGDDDDKPTSMAAEIDVDEISEPVSRRKSKSDEDDEHGDEENVESVGAEDALEEVPDRASRKPRKQYRIQEVIKRRQILLVQVVKEERGNKGAALTTYLSLAGRYSVLMPNTARGGGISRKITNVSDRKRLKEIARELEVPQGMGVILRTAGANRTRVEVKRDFEYLMRLWENVRNLTLKSSAPALVYEEGSLIKRSIRDLYNKEISEVVVSGEEGYREAKDFMKMLMPSHAKVVQPYRELMPIFARSGIDAQLDRMLQPQVTLKSGGYIIINQTEALVAIDVNSGRSTREHSIEDTALQTNLEAAEEVARQLRLRDLAGLIVIDFIDMEEGRNNRAVEKRVKECLKNDRARIQVGRISHFGLLEMSRQRIRASVLESTMQVCSHCGGTGHIRSESSVALHVLRGIEEYLLKNTTHDVIVRTTSDTALYMLNHKRDTIVELEQRFGLNIAFSADSTVGTQHFAIDRGAAVENPVTLEHITATGPAYVEEDDDDPVITEDAEADTDAFASSDSTNRDERRDDERGDGREDGNGRKRRRRRRRGGRRQNGEGETHDDVTSASDGETTDSGKEANSDDATVEAGQDGDEQDRQNKRRRRGKRGGRRNREEDNAETGTEESVETAGESVSGSGSGSGETSSPAQADAETPGSEASVQAEPAETPAPAETALDEAPVEKPKRIRKSRAKKAPAEKLAEAPAIIETTDNAAADAGSETAAPIAETPSEPSEVVAGPVAEEAPAKATPKRARRAQTDPSAIASAPVVTSSGEGEKAEKPKKAGWWQKRGFF